DATAAGLVLGRERSAGLAVRQVRFGAAVLVRPAVVRHLVLVPGRDVVALVARDVRVDLVGLRQVLVGVLLGLVGLVLELLGPTLEALRLQAGLLGVRAGRGGGRLGL